MLFATVLKGGGLRNMKNKDQLVEYLARDKVLHEFYNITSHINGELTYTLYSGIWNDVHRRIYLQTVCNVYAALNYSND